MKICRFLNFTSRVTRRPPDFRLEIFESSLPELKGEATLLDRREETGEGVVRNRMLIRCEAGSVEAYVYYVDGIARSWCMMNGTGFFKGFYAAGVYWDNPDGTIYHEGVYQQKEENAKS
jgi:hypothetical protein